MRDPVVARRRNQGDTRRMFLTGSGRRMTRDARRAPGGGERHPSRSPPPRLAERGAALRDAANVITSIKVSVNSTTRGVAAAMAHLSRDSREMDVLAGSGRALATALKACAAARKMLLDDNRGVAVSATIIDGERRLTRLRLVPLSAAVDVAVPSDTCAAFSASRSTNPSALAGALAARLREGKTALVSCVGIDSATRAATALALATRYLGEDAEEHGRIVATCHFTEEQSEEGTITVLNLHVHAI
jgi:stage V sporulation protein SpoVS